MSERRCSVWLRLGRRLGAGAAVLIAVGSSVVPVQALGPFPAAPPDTATSAATTAPSTVATTTPTATTGPSPVVTTTPPTGPATDTADDGGTSSVSTIGVVIGGIGILTLLGIAAWWMVRRDDEDDAPHPPGPSSYTDLI